MIKRKRRIRKSNRIYQLNNGTIGLFKNTLYILIDGNETPIYIGYRDEMWNAIEERVYSPLRKLDNALIENTYLNGYVTALSNYVRNDKFETLEDFIEHVNGIESIK